MIFSGYPHDLGNLQSYQFFEDSHRMSVFTIYLQAILGSTEGYQAFDPQPYEKWEVNQLTVKHRD